MAQMVFKVVSVSAENNVRGTEMRSVHLMAVDGEAFKSGAGDAPPIGSMHGLFSLEFARPLKVGDEVTVILKERE